MASLPGGNSVIAPAQLAEFAKEGWAFRRGANTGSERETQPAPIFRLWPEQVSARRDSGWRVVRWIEIS
jgi:hypothetical protein